MQYSLLTLERQDGVATVTLNRPERGNALNPELQSEMENLFLELGEDNTVRVMVLTGAGSHFCTGADIEWFRSVIEKRRHGVYDREVSAGYIFSTRIPLALRNMPQPTIASINGSAIGGGITLALNCDIRIAAEDARISFPFVSTVGVTPELGSTYNLPRIVGIAKACELIFTGKSITGREAKDLGLVNDAVSLDDLQTVTSDMAKSIAAAAPTIVQLSKKALYHGMNSDIQSQLLLEEEELRQAYTSEEHDEAVKAFFEKRKPVFKGRK